MVATFLKAHYRKAKDRSMCTHTSLIGGAFVVPNEEKTQDQLCHAFEKDMKAGVPFFINEIATSIFKMFLDLDFYVPRRLSHDDVGALQSVVSNVFRRFYSEAYIREKPMLFECIALHADSEMLCSNRNELESFVTPVQKFCGTGQVTVGDHGSVDAMPVLWKTAIPSGGTYEFAAENELVVLTNVPDTEFVAFVNPIERFNLKEESHRVKGQPPPDHVIVEEALQRNIVVEYRADTVFSLNKGEYFMNCAKNAEGNLKHGFHFIFPTLLVNIEQALYMREALIEELKYLCSCTRAGKDGNPSADSVRVGTKRTSSPTASSSSSPQFSEYMTTIEWENAIDNSVYGAGKGLRMFGANKARECPACHGKRDQTCTCMNGKVDLGRANLLHSVYVDGVKRDDREELYRAQLFKLIKNASIRSIANEPIKEWAIYPGCPRIGNMYKTTVTYGENGAQMSHKVLKKSYTSNAKMKYGTTDVRDDDCPAKKIVFEEMIRDRFHPKYKKLRVTRIQKTSLGVFWIHIAGEGRHFCLNRKPATDHRNSTIYFQADKKGVCVRCHCSKPDIHDRREGVPCKQFRSNAIPFKQRELAVVFPESVDLKKMSTKVFGTLPQETALKIVSSSINTSKK